MSQKTSKAKKKVVNIRWFAAGNVAFGDAAIASFEGVRVILDAGWNFVSTTIKNSTYKMTAIKNSRVMLMS